MSSNTLKINYFQIAFFLVCVQTLSTCEIIDSHQLVEYSDANLDLYPRQFEVTAPLVVANPFDGCETYKNKDQVKGKIVVVLEGKKPPLFLANRPAGRCFPQEKTKIISELGGVGAILAGLRGSLGLYYNWAPPGNKSILLPALSTPYVDFVDVIQRTASGQNVTFTIKDTKRNPWLELGHSAIGILFQVYFQILAFAAFVIAVYKLAMFSKYNGIKLHNTLICLMFEIMSSVLRITMMVRPLSFYKFGYSVVTESFLVGYSNDLSFTTDLLITFYCNDTRQEILVQYNQQYTNSLLNNLGKFKIPFVIASIIVWTIDTISNLTRVHIIRTFENSILFSSIVNIILISSIAAFFLFTGKKILGQLKEISGDLGRKQVSKLTKFIIVIGVLLVCQIVGIILNMVSFTNISVYTHLFVYWLYWTGLFGASVAKPNKNLFNDSEKQSVVVPVSSSSTKSSELTGSFIEMQDTEDYEANTEM